VPIQNISLHGFCSQSNQCKVTYKFKVAKEPIVNEYVPIETLITGKYFKLNKNN